VVVTGRGALTPAGGGVDRLWSQAVSGRTSARRIDRFDPSAYDCQVAGFVDGFVARERLPPRLAKTTDRFTHLALVAAEDALADAGLQIGVGVDAARAGVMVGTVLGGWDFAEDEVRRLWNEGARYVSPYMCTAWFPTAPQGQICIRFGLKGRARTLICDRASAACALVHAAETIHRGQADVMIAGGTEQPVAPFAWVCCQTSGFLTKRGNERPEEAYRPFDREHSGSILGEGSAFLVLEELEHARARGAAILAEVRGWDVSNDGYLPLYTLDPQGRVMGRSIRRSLERAGVRPGDLAGAIVDSSALPPEDAAQVRALQCALGADVQDVPVTSCTAAITHLLGAASAVDAIVAVEALRRRTLPPVTNLERPAPGFDLDLVRARPRDLGERDHLLLTARGLGGVNACMVLSAKPQ
jgi:3-oxoacyl-(acyl-carrier-protein) synthase